MKKERSGRSGEVGPRRCYSSFVGTHEQGRISSKAATPCPGSFAFCTWFSEAALGRCRLGPANRTEYGRRMGKQAD